jgi:predicted lipoprotein with Yx(FWY)xxD motif
MRNKAYLIGVFIALAVAATGCAGQGAGYGSQRAAAAPSQEANRAASATSAPASPMPPGQTPTAVPTGTSAPQQAYNTGLNDYGYGSASSGMTATPNAGPGTSSSGQPTVGTATSTLGVILVDGQGHTLYALTKDSPGVSMCEASCLQTWPPLIVSGAPVAGDGVQSVLLGTMTRSDGSTQVTYDGKPLYSYAGDRAPGDVTGQGIGGVWFAVTPTGGYAR